MTDNQMVERVKLLLSRGPVDSVTTLHPVIPTAEQQRLAAQDGPTSAPPQQGGPQPAPPPQAHAQPAHAQPAHAAPDVLPGEALQVLTLAQRTAEDHIAAANQHAQKTREESQERAEQIEREARVHAEKLRAEADQMLIGARAAAELTNREAHTQAAEIRRQAELLLVDARMEAERIVARGHEQAEELRMQAEQRYEDAVGGLAVKREALQKQIEALEVFNGEYRSRLTSFLQGQLRALWADRPQATDVPEIEPQVPGGPVESTGRH